MRSPETPVCPAELAYDRPEALHVWLEAAAAWLGVEAELVEVPYTEMASLVSGAVPALLCLPEREKPGFLALLGRQRRRVLLLGPDLAVHRVPVEVLCTAYCHAVETPLAAEVEHVLDAIGLSGRHRHRARRALLGERLSGQRLEACWVLRLPAAASFWQQLRQAHLPHRLGGLLGAYAAQYLCGILAWWLLGWGALHGCLEPAWLLAWGLLRDGAAPAPVEHLVAGAVGIRGRRVAENPLARGYPTPCPRGDAPAGGRAIPGAGIGS